MWSALRAPGLRGPRVYNINGALVRRHGSSAIIDVPSLATLTSILVANRGEIALRVARTASQSGVRTVTVYTNPDARSQHVLNSPFTVNLGEASGYLDGDRIIAAAKREGCVGLHPGYGFLSENADFARKCTEAGLVFIGPPWKAIEAMGNKSRSKEIMIAAGVPCIPGYHGNIQDPEFLKARAEEIGYPVLLKAVRGGGGKGMRIASSADVFLDQLKSAKSEARNSFGDDVMLVEKYITTPRHIEVQVFADKYGNCVALGERDCSIQRRHQKILEETPAPNLQEEVRQDLWAKARAAALAVKYEGAGTVEFIFDNNTGEFFFMEMNTRLQVEHPVTEEICGEDLVRWQFLVAEGKKLPLDQEAIKDRIAARGWAIEARIYAENPYLDFMPGSGRLVHLRTPKTLYDIRVDAGFIEGDEVSTHYDPMIAKLIVRGSSRPEAILKLKAALEQYEIVGPATNIEFLKKVCEDPSFMAGDVETGFIEKHRDQLFSKTTVEAEAFAQAAISVLLNQTSSNTIPYSNPTSRLHMTYFGLLPPTRQFSFIESARRPTEESEKAVVRVSQVDVNKYDISVNDIHFAGVESSLDLSTKTLTSLFPHTRLSSTIVRQEDTINIFQQGKHYKLELAKPAWVEKALGTKATKNSVLAPMPCKILRVDVAEGDTVQKDQALVVIESMKMETVIRSPQNGVISKVVHNAGDLCKAGVALVEFEEPLDGSSL